ncbi:MAG: sulfite exporter TauE/SafE family protein [Planctomycetia bacterium]|nr:sulfite exporter TauE/SafE family protein [Planctomycetia bacterium]
MSDALLCLAAVVAGAINSVAGGGTLLTFPALYAVLGHSAAAARFANCTSTVALMPGSLAGAWGYRRELAQSRRWIVWLAGPSLLGGMVGSMLLTELPAEGFQILVPWLILTAAVLFAAQPRLGRLLGIGRPHAVPSRATIAGIIVFQFLVAVYGGYFGAGIGILMLAALAMMGLADIHAMNGLKTLFASLINGVSVVWFIWRQEVDWRYAWMMIISAVIGGYLGATVARRLDRDVVRRGVVLIGLALAAWEFYRRLSS